MKRKLAKKSQKKWSVDCHDHNKTLMNRFDSSCDTNDLSQDFIDCAAKIVLGNPSEFQYHILSVRKVEWVLLMKTVLYLSLTVTA